VSSPGNPAPRSAELCGPWANPDDVGEKDRPLASTAQWVAWLMAASEVLYALSGRQWSGAGCTATVELRNQPPAPGTGAWPYYRTWGESAQSYWWWSFSGWAWFPRYVGIPPQPMAIKLPHDEVVAITDVTVQGVAFTAYRLLKSGWIERTDGRRWVEFTGATVINYTYGDPPSEMGVQAAVRLAVELVKDSIGEKCELPKRVTSITRQGIAVAVIDPMIFLKEGRTGLYEVDLFLAAVNPQSRRSRATVWSPDIPRALRSP
jgi:hypothetical protein